MPRTSGDIMNAFKSLKKENAFSIGDAERVADFAERGYMDSFRQVAIRVQCGNRNWPSPVATNLLFDTRNVCKQG